MRDGDHRRRFQMARAHGGRERVRLHVWDTAGQEQFRVISRPYYRQADGALLVYDVTSAQTMHALDQFIEDAREYCPLGVVMVLLGNKCDRPPNEIEVSAEQGENFARRRGIPLMFQTSAKNGQHVDEAFEVLCRHVMNNQKSAQLLTQVGQENGTTSPPRPLERHGSGLVKKTPSKGPVKLKKTGEPESDREKKPGGCCGGSKQ